MKKFYFLLLLLPALSQAQTNTLQLGTREFKGLSTNTYGIMNSWNGGAPLTRANRHATIYPLQNIGIIPAGSKIMSVKFYRDTLDNVVAGSLQANPTFKLYIKNTPLNTFSTAVTWQDTANTMTEIFNGDPTGIVGNATGWVTFTIPGGGYTYDGSNMMLLWEYVQTVSVTGSVTWSYDTTTVDTRIFVNYYNSTQNRYNSPVTALPFPANTTGSNIRHPSIQIVYELAPIPVKLEYFNAAKKTNAVTLTWKTLLETGRTNFIIQRQTNNGSWVNLATVPAKNIATGSVYEFTDTKPQAENLYRLEISEDGISRFSENRFITFTNPAVFTLQPNPVTNGMATLTFKTKTTTAIQILSTDGRLVSKQSVFNQQQATIDISNLAPGIYFIRETASGYKQKLVKN